MQSAARQCKSGKGELFEPVGKIEHMFQIFVVAYNPVTDSSTGFDNQTGDIHETVDKTFKFHSHNGQSQWTVRHKQAIPGF